jgi:hypothetical protein
MLPAGSGCTGSGTWQTIVPPNGGGLTVVSGINNAGDICGWYLDTTKDLLEGFVATAGGSQKPVRKARGSVQR